MDGSRAYIQRNFNAKFSFTFHSEQMEYSTATLASNSGFNVKYDAIAPVSEYGSIKFSHKLRAGILFLYAGFCLWLVFGLVTSARHYSGTTLAAAAVIAVVMVIAAYVGVRLLRKKGYTVIPVGQGRRILVAKNDQHQEIIEEIQRRRLVALRKYAVIDALASPQQNLKKLIWLKEQGAITEQEYSAYAEQLAPFLPGAMPPAPSATPTRH